MAIKVKSLNSTSKESTPSTPENFCLYGEKRSIKDPTYSLTYYSTSIRRFNPTYWRVDGSSTSSFSLTPYLDGFQVIFQCRMTDDLVGIIWDSVDSKDHKFLRYETNYDYSGLVWDFEIELSPSMPVLNDPQYAPTITVEYLDNQGRLGLAYIALWNYADNPSGRKSKIRIDWDTVKGGFTANASFNVRHIKKIFLGGYVSGYSKNSQPFPTTREGYLRVTNSTVTGISANLDLYRVYTPKHNIGMCTSYDDHYDLNPQRLVNNMKALGYSGFMNHYCGMSHYPEMNWDSNLQKFQIPNTKLTGANVVNPATAEWHRAFAKALKKEGMQPVFSVSYEMYSLAANEYWAQRDVNDNLGRTGYEPPSYFFSMCNEEAIEYLHKAFREFAQIMVDGECEVIMQIGEPWHWYNPKTNMPCVYDYATKVAFNQDTGRYAPDLGTIYEANSKTGGDYDLFKDWLRNKLGMACRDIRTMLKSYFPNCQVCPLIFFPTIRTHIPSLVTYINYPEEHYSYPNFDFIMTEAYDWLLEARLDLAHEAVAEIPIDELGYPPEKVAYLSGFVPDSAIAYLYRFDYTKNYRKPIWQRIFGDMDNNKDVGVWKQLIWAYPQVMFDSITIDNQNAPNGFFFGEEYLGLVKDNTAYSPDIFGENLSPPSPPEILKPYNVITYINTNTQDILIEFDVDNDQAGISYEVNILNSTGLFSVWRKHTDVKSVILPAADRTTLGLGTYLKILIVPSEGEASVIVDVDAISTTW